MRKSIGNRKIGKLIFLFPTLGSMLVAEKLDWKGLTIKKSVGNRKIKMSDGST
jgi:hypothetical protein